MFGYIVINKPELKVKEFDEYMAYYCGLCRALKEEYGIRGQISLSYDLTFLGMLLTGLYDTTTRDEPCKCIFHPLEKRRMKKNEFLDYTADMNLLLTYLKCQDDWKDEKKADKAVYGTTLRKAYQRIREKYPEKIKIIEQQFELLSEMEAKKLDDIDLLSGCFGKVLGEVFTCKEDEWAKSTRRIGFMLGKFIYILDAYDDLEKDAGKGNFNPFLNKSDNPGFDEWMRDILTMAASSCAEEFEKLPIIENVEILRNILYSGIWTKYELVLAERKSNK
jgi:hypothetical protein